MFIAHIMDCLFHFIYILTGKPTGKRPLRRPSGRWEDNIRMDLEEKGVMRVRLRIGIIGEPL